MEAKRSARVQKDQHRSVDALAGKEKKTLMKTLFCAVSGESAHYCSCMAIVLNSFLASVPSHKKHLSCLVRGETGARLVRDMHETWCFCDRGM